MGLATAEVGEPQTALKQERQSQVPEDEPSTAVDAGWERMMLEPGRPEARPAPSVGCFRPSGTGRLAVSSGINTCVYS